MLLAVSPSASSAASIDRLYCNGLIQMTTDTPEYVLPKKAVLNGDHFRLWVERWVPRNTKQPYPIVTFDENWGVGYELDGSTPTGIVPVSARELTIIVSFSQLRKGPHRLRIGLMSPDGRLMYDNTFCFASPGSFSLTER
jgi:hypothetical protein